MEEVDSSDISTVEQKFVPSEISFEPNEDPEKARSCIDEIREWISANEEFYGRTDDSFILRFLRVCKFDLERTKQRIYRSYSIKHNNPKWFSKTKEHEEMVEDLINQKLYYSMHYAGNATEHVLLLDTVGLYPMKYPVDSLLGVALALFTQIWAEDSRSQTEGLIYVSDCAHIKWETILQITPSLIWRTLKLITGGEPLKIKGFHIINAPSIANKIVHFLKYFLSKKLQKRFFVHENAESLHEQVPPEHLPLEFGGTAGPAQTFADLTRKQFKESKALHQENQKYGINKSPPHSAND